MLSTLTTITTLASMGLAQIPAHLDLPSALEGVRIEVSLQATSNHFAAENASECVQVLLFGSAGLEPRAVRLEPGASVLYPFPRRLTEEMTVEVVALDESGWRNTGAVLLGDVQGSGQQAAWVQAGPERSVLWIVDEGQALAHLQPSGHLVPDAWLHAHPELTCHTPATHVPVPLPTEDKKSGKPPVIEEKLPPV